MGLSIRKIANKDIDAILDYWESGTEAFFKSMGVDKSKIPNRQIIEEKLQKEVDAEEIRYLIAVKDGTAVGCGLIECGDVAQFHFHLWGETSRNIGDGPYFAKKMLEKFSDELSLDEIRCHISVENKHANYAATKNGGIFIEEKIIPAEGMFLERSVRVYSWKPAGQKSTD